MEVVDEGKKKGEASNTILNCGSQRKLLENWSGMKIRVPTLEAQ
jgi:hypothetical protein